MHKVSWSIHPGSVQGLSVNPSALALLGQCHTSPAARGALTPTPGSVLSEHCWLQQAAPNVRNISLATLLCPLHGFCSVIPFAQPLDVMAVASELYPFKCRRLKKNSDLHNECEWGFSLVV